MTDAFHIGLNKAEQRTFLWLMLGHLLFAGALFWTIWAEIQFGNAWVMPLFGAPLLALGPRDRLAVRALALLVGIPVAHWAAGMFALLSLPLGAGMVITGGIAGLVGSAGALALLHLLGLLRRDHTTLRVAEIGIALLTFIAMLGVYHFLNAPGDQAANIVTWLWLYTPWQIVFSWVLAKTLK